MSGETVKSTAITQADATPPVRVTSGVGSAYTPIVAEGRCAVATAMDNTSRYRLVRVPSNAYIKKVEVWLDAANTTAAFDVGVYYADAALDQVGSSGANTGTTDPMTDADLFAAAYDAHAIVTPTEVTFNSAEFTGADLAKQIWNVADSAITSDPGGYFDVVAGSTSTSSGAAVLNCRVTYALPGSH